MDDKGVKERQIINTNSSDDEEDDGLEYITKGENRNSIKKGTDKALIKLIEKYDDVYNQLSKMSCIGVLCEQKKNFVSDIKKIEQIQNKIRVSVNLTILQKLEENIYSGNFDLASYKQVIKTDLAYELELLKKLNLEKEIQPNIKLALVKRIKRRIELINLEEKDDKLTISLIHNNSQKKDKEENIEKEEKDEKINKEASDKIFSSLNQISYDNLSHDFKKLKNESKQELNDSSFTLSPSNKLINPTFKDSSLSVDMKFINYQYIHFANTLLEDYNQANDYFKEVRAFFNNLQHNFQDKHVDAEHKINLLEDRLKILHTIKVTDNNEVANLPKSLKPEYICGNNEERESKFQTVFKYWEEEIKNLNFLIKQQLEDKDNSKANNVSLI